MPRALLDRLADALLECKTLLERMQPELQGPHWLPPVEVTIADAVLAELASMQRPSVTPTDRMIGDSIGEVVTRMEAFGDAFVRLASTPDQRELAASFQGFVGEMTAALDVRKVETGSER